MTRRRRRIGSQPTLRAQLNALRERNALLGEAIMPSEQFKQ
jgi:hypothetical protein